MAIMQQALNPTKNQAVDICSADQRGVLNAISNAMAFFCCLVKEFGLHGKICLFVQLLGGEEAFLKRGLIIRMELTALFKLFKMIHVHLT